MPRQWIAAILVVGVALLAWFAWRGSQPKAPPEAAAPTGTMMPPVAAAPLDPGVRWDVPHNWSEVPASSMRLATYRVPAANADAAVECAVYYFGPGQGGSTEANLERWLGEFENPEKPLRATSEVAGMKVTRVRVKGAYATHAAGLSAPPPVHAHQQLLAAIVEGPAGPVFFKLVGPSASVDAAAADFDRMLASLQRK